MNTRHEFAIAALAVAVLGAAPLQAQGGSCDGGRGGLIRDLGFRRLPLPVNTELGEGAAQKPFAAEPRITGVRGDGPAAGRLRDGDVLVAVEGVAVTTSEGARRYARIEAGRPVRLSVRRDGRVQDVTLTPALRCVALAPDAPPAPPAPDAPGAPGAPDAPPPPPGELVDEARFGFGVECNDCGEDEGGVFRFRQPPVVSTVRAGSPAARAGLRVGDRLTHVDGVALTSAEGWARLSGLQPGREARITYTRAGQSFQATLPAR